MFTDCQILFEVFLVNPTKGAQEIPSGCPQSLNGIGMHLVDPIAIVIARPFFFAMTHREMFPLDVIVALPFIGITRRPLLGVAMHMVPQRLPIGMLANPQPALATLSANRPHNRRTVIGIRAVPALLVGAPPRRVVGVGVFVPFFPPRSETSRRFRSQRRAAWSESRSHAHGLAVACANGAHSATTRPTPRLRPSRDRLCLRRAPITLPAGEIAYSLRKGSPYRECRRAGRRDTANPQALASVSGRLAPDQQSRHSLDSAGPGDESVSPPKPYFRVRPVTL